MFRMKVMWLVMVLTLVLAAPALTQDTTTVETVDVEIVYVSGNVVIFVMDDLLVQTEVPEDFRVMVDGEPVPVSALVPGQKVRLERTTTTTVVPETRVVKVRNGEVVRVTGRTLVYREDGQNRSVVVPSDFRFMVNGRPVGLEALRPGMRLTATVVTEGGGGSTEVSRLAASSTAPEAPAPAPVRAPAPAPAPDPAPAKVLPSTASLLPLIGLLGGALFALGAGLSGIRRRQS